MVYLSNQQHKRQKAARTSVHHVSSFKSLLLHLKHQRHTNRTIDWTQDNVLLVCELTLDLPATLRPTLHLLFTQDLQLLVPGLSWKKP